MATHVAVEPDAASFTSLDAPEVADYVAVATSIFAYDAVEPIRASFSASTPKNDGHEAADYTWVGPGDGQLDKGHSYWG